MRLPTWVVAILLGAVCLIVYNANFRTIGEIDSLSARYQPLILWQDQTLALDDHARLVAHGHPIAALDAGPPSAGRAPVFGPPAFWVHPVDDGYASVYPVVTPLLVSPLYLPAALWLQGRGWSQPEYDRVAEVMEKLSASLLAAIASVLMFLLLRREKVPWALPLAIAFAFGTNTWMISSQALWQHGTGEILVVVALLLCLAERTPRRLVLLGLVCALMAANRPPDALIAAAFGGYVVWRDRRDLRWLVAGAALPLLALLAYNVTVVGNPMGGYNEIPRDDFFGLDVFGPAGLLVSPGRGLLVFTPFLLFLPVGLAQRLKDPATRHLTIALCVGVTAQLLFYSQADWRAGVSWGPRWLTDVLPILVWVLAPAPRVLRPAARRALVATIVAAIGIQAVGAFWYTRTSDERFFTGPGRSMSALWKPANTPFLVELQHRPAGRELQCMARGAIERVGDATVAGNGEPLALEQGAVLSGWALACRRTPAQVALLIDGVIAGETVSFTPRPDVDRVFGSSTPPGWSLNADVRGLRPGRHVLQLAVRVQPRSEFRIVREAPVDVTPPAPPPAADDLPGQAALAARRLREHQEDGGSWLTTFTAGTRYTAPTQERNTYTTAVLADLLSPIAGMFGLDPAVAAARAHLGAQIEPSGLVRYHGLPDAPGIGTLGCRITPDADDTALSWRISGTSPEDPRAARMLRTLRRYRDDRGLYRTWLAPQSRYECINPGTDPNPADLVNQMHVYLLLRRFDPAAARRLCRSIRRADDALVYYDRAPLVPYLRSAELGQLGCRLALPAGRLARAEPGQEPWEQLVRGLVAALGAPPEAARKAAARALLTRLGRDDFALLRATPPLLYHNDLSASVSRFYWSPDVGYALWLRLYAATA